MSLCQYKNIFGEPGQGAHKYRIFGLATIDLGLTALLAFLISSHLSSNSQWTMFMLIFVGLLVLAIFVHRLFCVDTALNRYLGIVKK